MGGRREGGRERQRETKKQIVTTREQIAIGEVVGDGCPEVAGTHAGDG